MRRVTIRIPDDIVTAFDMADAGSRSAIMRRVLTDAVADGDVEGVPPDLRKLAERERLVDTGKLARKRATYKMRCYNFYADKWEQGAVTPTDARELAASWRSEARLYDDDADGEPSESFLEAILDWYAANWSAKAAERPEWPDAGKLLRAAGIAEDADPFDAPAELVEQLDDYAAENVEQGEAVRRLVQETDADTTDAFQAIAQSDEYDRDQPDREEA